MSYAEAVARTWTWAGLERRSRPHPLAFLQELQFNLGESFFHETAISVVGKHRISYAIPELKLHMSPCGDPAPQPNFDPDHTLTLALNLTLALTPTELKPHP